MIRADESFLSLLQRWDTDSLAIQNNVVLGLWPDLSIALVNEAWNEFAQANDGEPDISQRFGLGASMLDAISGPLRKFYQLRLTACLDRRQTWKHLYECSSPDVLRQFQMSVYPLREGKGLLVVHALVVEHPHEFLSASVDADATEPHYRTPAGIVIQCGHCRRVQSTTRSHLWYWVPKWVAHSPCNTSHGLCPACVEYYYNEMDGDFPEALSFA